MLSAVELHSGGGSGFYHHPATFSRTPVSSDPYTNPPQMSGTEFARPKPKTSSLNGLSPAAISPPTHKYSHHLAHEQNGPVNLAVNHHHQPSRQQASTPDKEQNSDKEIDVVGLGGSSGGGVSSSSGNSISFATTSSNSRISSFPAGLGSNAYQALNYSFYGNRYSTPLFSHRSPYPPHASRPTYLDAYSPSAAYLASYGSSAYSSASSPLTPSSVEPLSPSTIPSVGLAPPPPHKSTNERSHSMSSLTNGHHHHQHHPYAMKEKEPKSAGPRLTGNADNSVNNFKVPSGKEGSLKHRILTTTRPHENNKYGTINHPAHRSSINNNSYLNFTRGSLIELSNGLLRRVEDLRTEDFVMSAEKSTDLQLADSTVVKILPAPNNFVMITFSYDNNRSKVDIEAKMEHPFFVYGQGWASCNPEGSMQAFGLKCQRLQVGDVCISLKPREQKLSPPLSPMAQKRPREMFQQPPSSAASSMSTPSSSIKDDMMPQNLSRRPLTIPTTATDTPMSSYSIYNLQMSLFAAASQGRMPPAAYASFLNQEEVQKAAAVAAHLQTNSSSSLDLNTSSMNNNNNNSPDKLPMKNSLVCVDEYDDLQARKRRWSAPDIDADEQQQQLRKISNI